MPQEVWKVVNYMQGEMIRLTSTAQSGFSSPSGTKRRWDIGYGLNALQEKLQILRFSQKKKRTCEAP